MSTLQRTTKSNKGVFIYSNGNSVFIKQPNIMEIAVLYQTIIANIKMIDNIFKISHKKLTQIDS